jgi:Protein of unknown function (DUF2442)
MTIVASNDPRILTVEVTDDLIVAHLADGRTISVPLAWSWRLSNATPAQRQHFEIIGTGQGVHWPDIDEDLSAIGMLTGTPASPQSKRCSIPVYGQDDRGQGGGWGDAVHLQCTSCHTQGAARL